MKPFRLARTALALIVRGLARTARRQAVRLSPSLGLRLAPCGVRFAARLAPDPSPAFMMDLLGPMPPVQARRLGMAWAAHDARNDVFRILATRKGLGAVTRWIHPSGFESLHERRAQGQPALLMFSHIGPSMAVPAGLLKEQLPALVLRTQEMAIPFPAPLEALVLRGHDPAMALTGLKRAMGRLRERGFVLIAGDGAQGAAAVELPFLEGRFPFQRGLAALHRLTGAPIVPITAHWRAGTPPIEVTVHPPLDLPAPGADPGAYEVEVLRVVAHWLDHHHRQHPEQMRVPFYRRHWTPSTAIARPS